jgi:hypothetical protein
MRGNLGKQTTGTVEQATQEHREACELRLARIQNGAEPSHKNGPHIVTLFATTVPDGAGWQWQSTSGRKSPVFRSQTRANDWRRTHPAWD